MLFHSNIPYLIILFNFSILFNFYSRPSPSPAAHITYKKSILRFETWNTTSNKFYNFFSDTFASNIWLQVPLNFWRTLKHSMKVSLDMADWQKLFIDIISPRTKKRLLQCPTLKQPFWYAFNADRTTNTKQMLINASENTPRIIIKTEILKIQSI